MRPSHSIRPCRSRPPAVMLAAALAAAAPAHAQERPPALSREIDLGDFGLDGAAEIARGRVAVVHAPDGPRLEVHFLARDGAAVPSTAPEPETLPVDSDATPEPGARPAAPSRAASDVPPGPSTGPPSGPPGPQPGTRQAESGGPPTEPLQALWVWTTQRLLELPEEREEFLGFVEAQGIDRVFLQLVPEAGAVSAAGFVPFDRAATGRLVADLRARGALTYALDGDPRYVGPENREGLLRTVARVVEHNRSAPPEQRFLGVRYDIEPYLLPGFQSPRRGEILAEYLAVVEALSGATRGAGLPFAVDIPFWLDAADEVTGEPFEAVEGGVRTPVLSRVLELSDDVAVMAYRTVAGGPDGVLEHARGELGRAARRGVGVFVGLETTALPDERRHTFRGPGRPGLPPLADAPWVVLEERAGDRARMWLVEGVDALGELERATSGARALTYWFAGTPVALSGAVLSFHSLGAEAMRQVADEVLAAFGGGASFRGIAYHDYDGLRALLDVR